MLRCWIRGWAAIVGLSGLVISSAGLAQAGNNDLARSNTVAAAISWLERTLLGTVATIAAVIAVAMVGLMMLTGRMDVRRAVRVILGCFIIFGASAVASGLVSATLSSSGDRSPATDEPQVSIAPVPAVPVDSVPAVSDPYAGAAVPPR
jgi:type IV secretory pathway VirB2 component (pilin)